jgi:hypothetical protein
MSGTPKAPRTFRVQRWFAELGPARLVLAALALLAAGTAATAVAVPADTRRSDTWTTESIVSKASYAHRDLVLTAPPGSAAQSAADITSIASDNLAALPPALSGLVSQTSITRQYDHLIPATNLPANLGHQGWLRLNWASRLNTEVHYAVGGAPGAATASQTLDPVDHHVKAVTMTVPIAVSQPSAAQLGFTIGSQVKMGSLGTSGNVLLTLNLRVDGIFAPATGGGADDPLFRIADKPVAELVPVCVNENCPGRNGDQVITVWESDVFVQSPEPIAMIAGLSQVGSYSTVYDYLVDPARLTPSVLPAVGPALDQANLGVTNFQGGVTMNTGLKALAAAILSAQSDSHRLSAVVLGAVSAGALAALFLMLRLTVLRRARHVALCRARGASPLRLALRHATQTSMIVLAFAVGGAFAVVAAGRGSLRDPAAWSGAVLVTLLTFAMVGYSVFRSGDRVVAGRHEAVGETARGRRIVRDVGLLLAAGGALAIYRTQDSANADSSIDWLAVAAPALLALAAGIAAVRLMPALFGPAVRLLARSRSVVGFAAAALSGRRVRVVAAPLAGLVVVVAAGMFAAGYDASVRQKVRDDTVRTVGAAARIETQPDWTPFPDGFAAAAAKVPGVRSVFGGRVEYGGVAPITPEGISQARPLTVITVDPEAFRKAAADSLSDSSARGQAVPANWPAPIAADGTVTLLASPSLAGLFPGPVELTEAAGSFKAVIGAYADVPLADSVVGRGGTDYLVVPAGEVPMVDPGKPNVEWLEGDTGAISASALRALPGMASAYTVTTLGDVQSQAYGQGRVSAARDVFHLVEGLCVGYFALCLLQLLTATRDVSRDSALLLQVFGLRAGRSRLVAMLVPLPVAVLAVAAGLGMGAGLSPMLGSFSHGQAGGSGGAGGAGGSAVPGDSVVATGSIGWGWAVPVVTVVLAMTVAGVLLDQLLRRRIELSVRLRDAEFE